MRIGLRGRTVTLPGAQVGTLWREGDFDGSVDSELPNDGSGFSINDDDPVSNVIG